MKKVLSITLFLILSLSVFASGNSESSANDTNHDILEPGDLVANVWRSGSSTSGNTIKWTYQVSAYYKGNKAVEWIETRWQHSASLRNGASFSIGNLSIATSSSWTSIKSKSKYWKNTLGQKEASYRSNIAIGPKIDYRSGTICTYNTAKVKLKASAKIFSQTASR